MFPAIDLFTGEKERGSIETLLSAPIERWKILVGKMMVIVLAGITTAILSLMGLFISLQMVTELPQEIMDVALGILTPQFILALIGMLLPLVIFFAGFMIPATVYAKSFKEASSILQPMNFLVITPAVIGMMPGVELNAFTAMIPVLNVVLTTKELIAGTLSWGIYLIVLASLLLLAAGAVTFSFRRFGNEKNVLRT
jgi:sodium transport system permease protein